MTLQKQTIPLSISRGISTKTDPKAIQAAVSTLENATFINPGKLKKRNGYAEVGPAPVVGTLMSAMPLFTSNGTQNSGTKAAMAFQNQVVAAKQDSLRTFNSSSRVWTPVAGAGTGGFYSATVTKQSVARNSYNATGPDSATLNGIQLTAWEDNLNGQRAVYSVVDTTTGTTITPPTSLGSKFFSPKCLVYGNNLIVLAVSNVTPARIYGGVLSSGTVTLTPLTPVSGLSKAKFSASGFDATVVQTSTGPQLYIVYNDASAGQVLSTIPLITSTGGISFWYSVVATPLTQSGGGQLVLGQPSTSLTVFADTKNQTPVLAYWTSSNVNFRAYDATMSTVLGSGVLDTGVASAGRITGVSVSSAVTSWQIFWTAPGGTTFNDSVRTNTVGAPYATGTAATLIRSLSVAGKAFVYASRPFVPLAFLSTLQPTLFVVAVTSTTQCYVAAKLLYGLIGTTSTTALLPESTALSATSWKFPALEKDLFTTVSGKIFTQNGVDVVTIDFSNNNSYQRATLGNTLHVSGGFVQMYDGLNVVEHNFHVFPENVTVPNPGGANTYQYIVCYEWMDNQGNFHRSAPSIAVTQKQGTDPFGGNVLVTIPTLRITAKQGPTEAPNLSPIYCVVYRTVNNGTSFFRCDSITNMPLNDITSDTTIFTDTSTDTAILGNPTLYTTGGVVENLAPNPCTSLITASNRVWGIDSLTGAIFFSKQVIPGNPVEFSDFLTFNADQRSGAPTALGVLDEKKIIFRTNTISFLSGQGPASDGTQNDLNEYFITSDVGCTNPRSIVTLPTGLMFQSAKGIYLLDRSLQVSYIGADVEAYNASTVTSALLAPNTNQVRLTMNSGICLVYDYYMTDPNTGIGQWSVFTNINAVDATVYGGQYTYASSSGVFQETPGVFADPSAAFIKMKVVSSWLQFAQMQGFQRVRKLLILGDWLSAHNLTVKLYFDFGTTATQTDVISAPSLMTPLQYRVFTAQQKCESLQISIEDGSSGTNGESLSLSALMLEVGVKQGAFKLPASKSYG